MRDAVGYDTALAANCRNELVDGVPKPMIQNAAIRLPDKPGLGVKLNEKVARRYARKGEPFFG